jgi:SAM-dependent methyltransferase
MNTGCTTVLRKFAPVVRGLLGRPLEQGLVPVFRTRSDRESGRIEAVPAQFPRGQPDHTRHTREVYDRLAPVWSEVSDDGPFNEWLERPAVRSLLPPELSGLTILDAGCGSGAQAQWLLDEGADVIGFDVSPVMVEEAQRRCSGRGLFFVADLAETLPLEPQSADGITCSLVLHYLEDWTVPLTSFAEVLRPDGWAVLSLEHPFGPQLPSQTGGYFDTELVSDTWTKADVVVTQWYWRRPLSAVMDAFAEHGFVIERIVEAQPSAEALDRFPDDLTQVKGVPWFIVYRLRLRGSVDVADARQ